VKSRVLIPHPPILLQVKDEQESDDSPKDEKPTNSDLWVRVPPSDLSDLSGHPPPPPPLLCPTSQASGPIFPNGKFLGRFPFFGSADQASEPQVNFVILNNVDTGI